MLFRSANVPGAGCTVTYASRWKQFNQQTKHHGYRSFGKMIEDFLASMKPLQPILAWQPPNYANKSHKPRHCLCFSKPTDSTTLSAKQPAPRYHNTRSHQFQSGDIALCVKRTGKHLPVRLQIQRSRRNADGHFE